MKLISLAAAGILTFAAGGGAGLLLSEGETPDPGHTHEVVEHTHEDTMLEGDTRIGQYGSESSSPNAGTLIEYENGVLEFDIEYGYYGSSEDKYLIKFDGTRLEYEFLSNGGPYAEEPFSGFIIFDNYKVQENLEIYTTGAVDSTSYNENFIEITDTHLKINLRFGNSSGSGSGLTATFRI